MNFYHSITMSGMPDDVACELLDIANSDMNTLDKYRAIVETPLLKKFFKFDDTAKDSPGVVLEEKFIAHKAVSILRESKLSCDLEELSNNGRWDIMWCKLIYADVKFTKDALLKMLGGVSATPNVTRDKVQAVITLFDDFLLRWVSILFKRYEEAPGEITAQPVRWLRKSHRHEFRRAVLTIKGKVEAELNGLLPLISEKEGNQNE